MSERERTGRLGRAVQVLGVMLQDIVLTWVSLLISLQLTGALGRIGLSDLLILYVAPLTVLSGLVLLWRRIYRIDARYVGIYDLLNFALVASIMAVGLRGLIWYDVVRTDAVSPWASPVLFGFLVLSLLAFARLYQRLVAARHILPVQARADAGARRTLIVGAGDAGEMVYRELSKPNVRDYHVVGFIDDAEDKQRSTIHGVPVRGKVDQIPRIVKQLHVVEVMIAIPTASGDEIRRIWSYCTGTSARVRTLPSLSSFVSGKVRILPTLRDLEVDDLLRRKRVDVDIQEVATLISGERVMVTGAGGSIGSELSRQVANLVPSSLILLGRGENSIFEIDQELRDTQTFHATPIICDVRDRRGLSAAFNKHYPSVVIHAAAHKHVPLMESVPIEAIQNNVFGTLNVVEESLRNGVKKFILVSTDKAVKPSNVMGATKRVAELIVSSVAAQSDCSFSVVRFGNVLGSRGSIVPTLQKQIKRGGPITLTHPEMTRFFMTIPEASQLILQAGAMGDHADIFILDMGEPISIVDLAHDMVRMHGLVPGHDIEIKFTGVRPGEKFHEELSSDLEDLRPSSHEKIGVVVSRRPVEWPWLKEQLRELHELCDDGKSEEARAFLMDLAWGKNIPPVQATGPELSASES